MKLYIKNNTTLNYKKIGELFDDYYKKISGKFYVGKFDIIIIKDGNKEYKMEINATKTKVNLYIDELDLEPKKVDMSDKKFPEIPKRRKEKINERGNN